MSSSPAARRLFVTGGSGLLGRHLLRAAEQRGWDVIAPGSAVLDIRNTAAVHAHITAVQPDAVVHLAYRGNDPEVIVDGSSNVAAAAAAAGARLVHLSTDVVFGGRPEPYVEADALSPLTDYGRWKAVAETAVTDAHPTAVLVRTSLIYAVDGPCPMVNDVTAVLTGGSTIRFFTDEVRCPVHAGDLAEAVEGLAGRHDVVGALHIAGPDALSRADIADRVARWLGFDTAGVPRASLAESGLVRPGVVVLDCARAASLGITCRSIDEALAR